MQINQLEDIRSDGTGSAVFQFVVSGSIAPRYGFVERYELKPYVNPYPRDLEPIDEFTSDVLEGSSWRVEAYCREHPCGDFTLEAHAAQYDKDIWSKSIQKPTDIVLSSSEIPTSYGLRLEVDKTTQEMITLDESLFQAGIKGLRLQTDAKKRTLTISSTTHGHSVPFNLLLVNKKGETIKSYDLMAPDQIEISDSPPEPVTRLIVLASGSLQVNVYPNPSSGEFSVVANDVKGASVKVTILSLTGNKIFESPETSGGKISVKIPSPKPGLYILLTRSDSYEQRQLIEIK